MRTTRVVCVFFFLVLVMGLGCQSDPMVSQDTPDLTQIPGDLDTQFDTAVFLTADCRPVDVSGFGLSTLNVSVGMRVRFVNSAAHNVTLLFSDELFGKQIVTLTVGGAETLAVQAAARGKTYSYSIEGCKRSGAVTGNPDVVVGGGGGQGGGG